LLSVVVITVGLLVVALPATAVGPVPRSDAPPTPVLDWQPCVGLSGFDCAVARVPLDYRAPLGSTIDVAVIKHPATDRARRIGSLFFNPGGPGGAGTQDLPPFFDLFPAELRARF
jgi:hypothetical protein